MNKIVSEKTELGAFVESSLVECFYRIFRVNVNTGEFEIYKDNELQADQNKSSVRPKLCSLLTRRQTVSM